MNNHWIHKTRPRYGDKRYIYDGAVWVEEIPMDEDSCGDPRCYMCRFFTRWIKATTISWVCKACGQNIYEYSNPWTVFMVMLQHKMEGRCRAR